MKRRASPARPRRARELPVDHRVHPGLMLGQPPPIPAASERVGSERHKTGQPDGKDREHGQPGDHQAWHAPDVSCWLAWRISAATPRIWPFACP